jgi:hypothetical protein
VLDWQLHLLNEQNIGKAAYYWTYGYNKIHADKTSGISLEEESISCAYITLNRVDFCIVTVLDDPFPGI